MSEADAHPDRWGIFRPRHEPKCFVFCTGGDSPAAARGTAGKPDSPRTARVGYAWHPCTHQPGSILLFPAGKELRRSSDGWE